MRLYYEAAEIVVEGEDAEFIRVDITDMTSDERDSALSLIKDIMSGKKYKLTKHLCGHDENGRCVMEEI